MHKDALDDSVESRSCYLCPCVQALCKVVRDELCLWAKITWHKCWLLPSDKAANPGLMHMRFSHDFWSVCGTTIETAELPTQQCSTRLAQAPALIRKIQPSTWFFCWYRMCVIGMFRTHIHVLCNMQGRDCKKVLRSYLDCSDEYTVKKRADAKELIKKFSSHKEEVVSIVLATPRQQLTTLDTPRVAMLAHGGSSLPSIWLPDKSVALGDKVGSTATGHVVQGLFNERQVRNANV